SIARKPFGGYRRKSSTWVAPIAAYVTGRRHSSSEWMDIPPLSATPHSLAEPRVRETAGGAAAPRSPADHDGGHLDLAPHREAESLVEAHGRVVDRHVQEGHLAPGDDAGRDRADRSLREATTAEVRVGAHRTHLGEAGGP